MEPGRMHSEKKKKKISNKAICNCYLKLSKDLKERDRKQQQMDQLLIETYGTAVSKAFSGVNSTNAVALAVFLFIYFFPIYIFIPRPYLPV